MRQARLIFVLIISMLFVGGAAGIAQCSICTKTAMQLGNKSATGMNSGVIYLMLAPFAVVGYIGFRWWKNEKEFEDQNANLIS